MTKIISLTATLAAISLVTAKAGTLADWTFETSQPATGGPFNPEAGSGQASLANVGSTANTVSSPSGNGSAHSFSSNGWDVGDYFQFTVSTVGYNGITIAYDQASSNTGPGSYGLYYSLNGTSFTQVGANYTVLANASPNPTWNPTTSSAIYTFNDNFGSALDNQSAVYFRLVDASTVSANGGTVGTAGTDRVDNFIVSGTAVPEPTTLALAGLGGLASLLAARRKS